MRLLRLLKKRCAQAKAQAEDVEADAPEAAEEGRKGDIDSGALVFQAEYEAELLRAMLAARLRRGWRDQVWDWAQDWA